MKHLIDALRRRRWAHLFVANLRILLGFGFVPAGLKKILGEPFTDPENVGAFHDFLDAFHATGAFYPFVGVVQLIAATLLMTQTYALAGALMTLPVMTTILVFCWSTGVVPTASVVTLMWLGTLGLIAWDVDRWLTIVRADHVPSPDDRATAALIDLSLWRACGAGILVFYGISCLVHGGVYRPRGVEFDQPAYYVLIAIVLFPVVTVVLERRRRRSSGTIGNQEARP
ncbi:MAG: hypothetical protein AAF772_08515 [Acidobacteriota bacterium]